MCAFTGSKKRKLTAFTVECIFTKLKTVTALFRAEEEDVLPVPNVKECTSE